MRIGKIPLGTTLYGLVAKPFGKAVQAIIKKAFYRINPVFFSALPADSFGQLIKMFTQDPNLVIAKVFWPLIMQKRP